MVKTQMYLLALIWLTALVVSFGVWQQSIMAGVFMFFFLPTMIVLHDAFKK